MADCHWSIPLKEVCLGGTGTSKVLQDATFALADPFGIPRMVFRENKEAFLWDSGMVLKPGSRPTRHPLALIDPIGLAISR